MINQPARGGRERLEKLVSKIDSLTENFGDGYARRGKGFEWELLSIPKPLAEVIEGFADELLLMAAEDRIDSLPLKCIDDEKINDWIVIARSVRRDLAKLIAGRKATPSESLQEVACVAPSECESKLTDSIADTSFLKDKQNVA